VDTKDIKLRDLAKLDIFVFIKYFEITTETGKPLSFKNHRYLIDIYNDFSPKQVWLKAAQLGLSTTAIIKTFFLCWTKDMDVIYTMPSVKDLSAFVGGKVNRIIDMNAKLKTLFQTNNTIEKKQIGNSVEYFRGTVSETAAISVSGDLLCVDEMDRSNLATVERYKSRLYNSTYKWEWYFSNPNIVNAGVNRKWLTSTQNHWFVKCSHCGEWHYMVFPDSFHEAEDASDTDRYVCTGCGKEIYADDIRNGMWVKKYKEAEYSGYWMPLWINPLMSAHDILEDYRKKPADYFYNFVCGLPVQVEGGEISENLIFQNCLGTAIKQEGRVVIGVDSGITKHYTIGNVNGIFRYGKTTVFSEIENLLLKYPNSIMVIDALPDITAVIDLVEKYRGRVYRCWYSGTDGRELIKWDNKTGNVHVDRSAMFQVLVDELNAGAIAFGGLPEYWNDYTKHFKSTYKLIEENTRGMEVVKWKCTDKLDHWLHSLIYYRTARDKLSFGDMLEVSESLSLADISGNRFDKNNYYENVIKDLNN